MSSVINFERLALYNQWMNRNIYLAAEKLSEGELNKDRGAYFSSITGTLNHIMVGDIFWFKRFSDHQAKFKSLEYFRGIERPESISTIIHADLASLKEKREVMDNHIVLFTSELTDELLSSTLRYRNSTGSEFAKNLGYLLQHVFNHQTHHRGQASALFHQAGVDVGVIDMLACIPNE